MHAPGPGLRAAPPTREHVVVVGAGIAGVACARALADRGVPVVVRDRGYVPGGRMASRTLDGRRVDMGASYFTARDERFTAVVDAWCRRGLARPWTDAFPVLTADGLSEPKPGPVRYAAPLGLRSLVADLATGLDVRSSDEVEDVGAGPTIDGELVAAVVLAMPDPQALDVLTDDLADELAVLEGRAWLPALALAAGWSERGWPELDGAFVADSPVLQWVADDGRRRGDGAPVLVAHSTHEYAEPWLDEPAGAAPEMLAALRELLGIPDAPQWTYLHRWSLARPRDDRDQLFHLGDARVGLCGDGWGSSRIETAWRSGDALGAALADRLS